MTFTLQHSSKFVEHYVACKDSTGIGDVHWTSGRKKADSDNIGYRREIGSRLFQNVQSNHIALRCSRVHQLRECCNTRAGILFGVKKAAKCMDIGFSGVTQKQIVKYRRRAPTFLPSKRRAQGVAYDAPGASFVPELISPAARSGSLARRVSSHGYRSGSCNGNDSRTVLMSAGEGDSYVVCDRHAAAADDLAQDFLFSRNASGKPETRRFEFSRVCSAAELCAGVRHRQTYRLDETSSPFFGLDVVRRPSHTRRQNAAACVANESCRAGLAAIHSEENLVRF